MTCVLCRATHSRSTLRSHSGYSSVGRASDCRMLQQSDGPWFDSGWPDLFATCLQPQRASQPPLAAPPKPHLSNLSADTPTPNRRTLHEQSPHSRSSSAPSLPTARTPKRTTPHRGSTSSTALAMPSHLVPQTPPPTPSDGTKPWVGRSSQAGGLPHHAHTNRYSHSVCASLYPFKKTLTDPTPT